MDLEESIREAQAGDVECYGAVVRQYQGRIRAFIAAYFPDRNMVDELAQRTFVWAFEHLKDYRPGTSFLSWLKSIARNTLLAELEALKRRARNQRKYLCHLQAEFHRRQLATDSGEDDRRTLEALRRCLESLPAGSRALIKRRYESGDSVAAIAAGLGTTANVVKVTLFRVRQALRRCIEGFVGDVGECPSNG